MPSLAPSLSRLPARRSVRRARLGLFGGLLLAAGSGLASAPPEPDWQAADVLYGHAVASLQQRRFPEAYGRFIALADNGHAPSAAMALWMWRERQERFGRDWDCSAEQLALWSGLAGQPTPPLEASSYARTVIGAPPPTRRGVASVARRDASPAGR